ncbi:hypothetical protein PHET_00364 [Paragonimus heterotremus]|uniref:C2H2-type domain-containing protein n=1 Tax=Paragonimus heterotremus TaxID=100268 RepID=A0A8J4SUY1_9TREM|nr:hypothetical protein PHET_00364 [Paragonimus heterotremus]
MATVLVAVDEPGLTGELTVHLDPLASVPNQTLTLRTKNESTTLSLPTEIELHEVNRSDTESHCLLQYHSLTGSNLRPKVNPKINRTEDYLVNQTFCAGNMADCPDSTAHPSLDGSGHEDADVTMCICPVCGYSASSPRGQDAHMESAHGECYSGTTNLSLGEHKAPLPCSPEVKSLSNPSHMVRSLSPEPSQDSCVSSSGLQASSTPHRTNTVLDSQKISLSSNVPAFPGLSAPESNLRPINITSLNNVLDFSQSTEFPAFLNLNIEPGPPGNSRTVISQTRTARESTLKHVRLTGKISKSHQTSQEESNGLLPQKVDSRRRYRCNMCSATFPWHGDLTEHLRMAHGLQKSRETARSGKAGSFCCVYCKYVAKYQSELRRHMRLHWGVKPFVCVFCSYRSAWKGDLKRHMESHHRERFSSEAELIKIMSQFKNNAGTTVNGVPLSASSIEDAYKFGENTMDHVATAFSHMEPTGKVISARDGFTSDEGSVGQTSFTRLSTNSEDACVSGVDHSTIAHRDHLRCHTCSYRAQNPSKLDNHMASHYNLKQFKCPVCEHRSNYKWDVKKHLRAQHSTVAHLPIVNVLPSAGLNISSNTSDELVSRALSSPDSARDDVGTKPEVLNVEEVGAGSRVSTHEVVLNWSARKLSDSSSAFVEVDVAPIDLSIGSKKQVLETVKADQPTPSNVACISHADACKPAIPMLDRLLPYRVLPNLANAGTLSGISTILPPGPVSTTAAFSTPLSGFGSELSIACSVAPTTMWPMVPNGGTTTGRPMGADPGVVNSSDSPAVGLLLNQWLLSGLMQTWQQQQQYPENLIQPAGVNIAVTESTPSLTDGQKWSSILTKRDDENSVNKTRMRGGVESTTLMTNSVESAIRTSELPQTPTEWSYSEPEGSENSVLRCQSATVENNQQFVRQMDSQRQQQRGRKSTSSYYASRISSSVGPKEEQWKRHQCSGCGHRSNWKWDINKHIKVAHPERTNITTVTLDIEEAKRTFGDYMNRLKLSRTRCLNDTGQGTAEQNVWVVGCSPLNGPVGEGYYRPYKCSTCGHRSNWKWDVRKHIKQMHNNEADVITLSLDEARRTIHQYKSCRRQTVRHSECITMKTQNRYNAPEISSTHRRSDVSINQSMSDESEAKNTLNSSVQSSPLNLAHLTENHPTEFHRAMKPNKDSFGQSNAALKFRSILRHRCRICSRRLHSRKDMLFHMHYRHPNEMKKLSRTLQSCKLPLHAPLQSFTQIASTEYPETPTNGTSPPMCRRTLQTDQCIVTEDSSDNIAEQLTHQAPPILWSRLHMKNSFQRRRILKAKRRSCIEFQQLKNRMSTGQQRPRPLGSRQQPVFEASSVDDMSVGKVKKLSGLLDEVLCLLGTTNDVCDVNKSEPNNSTDFAIHNNCTEISQLANSIQETLSECVDITFPNDRLNMSSSSNEENQSVSYVETAGDNHCKSAIQNVLHHPAVGTRFLRLATVLRTISNNVHATKQSG